SGYTSCGTQCPNCMMKKENFANIGKIVDKVERKRFPRADSQEMQKAVLKARKRIFEQWQTYSIFKVHSEPSTALWLFCHISE
ncbi:hypothetical protein L8P11_21700, partial [Enterobacter kobei]|nr:hypothetical protein [Enterobacter kobei]